MPIPQLRPGAPSRKEKVHKKTSLFVRHPCKNQHKHDTYTCTREEISHRHPFPIGPVMLSLALGVLPSVPVSLMGPLAIPLLCLPSPIVVRRLAEFFIIGAVRGLSTLDAKIDSFWLPTIRRAWLAVNMFSFGGEPVVVAAVGLRLRWVRAPESDIEWTWDARETDPARFNA